MARKKQEPKTTERARLIVPLEEAQTRIRTQLERGASVPDISINENEEAHRWYDFTAELLRQICSNDELTDEFTGRSSFGFGDINTGSYLKKLRSICDRLELLPAPKSSIDKQNVRIKASESAGTNSRRIFIVHGHDDGAKETVARFLNKLDLESIILHEQPNRGRTIIEKFEEYSDVAFAVVLLTPDDTGYPAGHESEAKSRARQNVILELGFFMAMLRRERVCVLYKSEVEVPSDYVGILYLPMDDSGAWQLNLAREIIAAGINLDLNKVI